MLMHMSNNEMKQQNKNKSKRKNVLFHANGNQNRK